MVPVVDLSRRLGPYSDEFAAICTGILRSGLVLGGPWLERFESEFAAWSGYRYAVAVSSGASALQLALQACGVKPGDEVIVPAFTAVPTASAVCALGGIPVPVDVDENTASLDPEQTKMAVTSSTGAVIPVHIFGRPAMIPDVTSTIIEDAAQAHGALHHSNSAATAYSFYPTKNLGGVGDGGAVLTDANEVADRVRRLRTHGMTAQYVHTEVAQNFRMSEIEAAFLSMTLPDLAKNNDRRREIGRFYRSEAPHLRWHPDHPDHVYHLCVLRHSDRAALASRLHAKGIASAVHYPLALTQQVAYRSFARCPCPRAEQWAAECVTVPCFPEMTDAEVEKVAGALRVET